MKLIAIVSLLPIAFLSCSGLEHSQQKEIKKGNERLERINRLSTDQYAPPFTLVAQQREPYPWEQEWIGRLPKISKEYFRCRGTHANPPLKVGGDLSTYQFDCNGFDEHSLPIEGKEESISPFLIDYMNALQAKTNRRVVITAGHRCPAHNSYVGGSAQSKHLVGALVSFYVEGFQDDPLSIAKQLVVLYKEDPRFGPLQPLNAKTWANKELEIAIHGGSEPRDRDNAHPYPYLTIELKIDRATGKLINTDWQKANRGYWKWSSS